MKTIAITIGEDMLRRIDAISRAKSEAGTNRSQFIREAIKAHVAMIEKVREEERERQILKRHRNRLHRQAMALIKEQAES